MTQMVPEEPVRAIDDPAFAVCLRPGGFPAAGKDLGLLAQFRADPPLRAEWAWDALATVLRPLQRAASSVLPRDLDLVAQAGAAANVSLLYAIVSGVLMLLWYSPSVHEAHTSLASLPPYSLGRIMQGLHRYSSDACMLFVALHALQVLAARAASGARWLAWVTGILLLALLWFDGWTGYWLAWDDRAARIAVQSARWIDVVPIFAEPFSRTFLADATVTSLHFFLVFFVHMLIPLAMGVALWLHIARLNRSRFLTTGRAAFALGALFVLLAIAAPAAPGAAASLARTPATVPVDWFYLAPLVVLERVEPGPGWALVLAATAFVTALPWILARRRPAPVTVVPDRCNGCRQCVVDCPYAAITMNLRATPHRLPAAAAQAGGAAASGSPLALVPAFPEERPLGAPDPHRVAVVDPALCVGCGICVGSCAPAAIDYRHLPVTAVRERMARWIGESRPWEAGTTGPRPARRVGLPDALAFLCTHSAASSLAFDPVTGIAADLPGYRVVPVPCTGWVHPYLVRRAFKEGYTGVLIGGCSTMPLYREGVERTDERIEGEEAIPEGRVLRLRFDRADRPAFLGAAAEFRKSAARLPVADPGSGGTVRSSETVASADAGGGSRRGGGVRRLVVAALLVVSLGLLIVLPSDGRHAVPGAAEALLTVSFRLAGRPSTAAGAAATTGDSEDLMPHMRGGVAAPVRDRAPVRLRVAIDGAVVHERAYPPHGIFGDGASLAIERLALTPGTHRVAVALGETADPTEWTHREERAVTVGEGSRIAVLFDAVEGFRWH